MADFSAQGGTFINCFVDANGHSVAFESNGYPSIINSTIVNYSEIAYNCFADSDAVIINSVFYPAPGSSDTKVAGSTRNDAAIDVTVDYCIFPEVFHSYSLHIFF